MKFEDANPTLLVGDANGVYIAQTLAEVYKEELLASGFKQEDIDILLAGPDHEHYLECWNELEGQTIKLGDEDNVICTIGDSGDLWAVPSKNYNKIEWEEI